MKLSKKTYTVSLLCVAVTFLFADQNLLSPNLTEVASEFHFSDSQRDELLGGQIALGFFLVGGLVSLVAGYCADIFDRCFLFASLVFFGESACFATYWARSYNELFICRVLTGISIGGATPVIFSLLADYYPGTARVTASTAIGISMNVGIALGQLIAGVFGPAYGWRVPFLLVSCPTLVLAVVVYFSAAEPARGDQEEEVIAARELLRFADIAKYASTSSSSGIVEPTEEERNQLEPDIVYQNQNDKWKVYHLFCTPSVLLIYLQGIPGCVPWGMIYTFLNDYFSQERGMSVLGATFALTMFGIGGFIGQLLGGYIGQQLYNRDMRYQCLLMGTSTLVSVLPMWYIINTPHTGTFAFYAAATTVGLTVNINGPNVRSLLQNVCSPDARGTAFAIFNLTDDIGKGAGPVLVVCLIEAFRDRQVAFNVVTSLWILCGLLLLSIALVVKEDEGRVQQRVRSALSQTIHSEAFDYRVEINPLSTSNAMHLTAEI